MAQKRKVKKKNKVLSVIKKIFIAAFIIAIIFGILAALSCTVLFNADEITASGSKVYSQSEIIEASDLSVGDNIILMNKTDVADKITQKLPLIGSAEINKKLPDKVVIKVKDAVTDMVFIHKNKYLYTCDYKAVKYSDKAPEKEVIIIAKIGTVNLGNDVEISEENKQAISLVNEEFQKQGIDDINQIDVKDLTDISIICLNRFKVMLGSSDNLEYKIANVKQIIESVDKKYGNKVQGTIKVQTLSDENNKSYFQIGSVSVEKIDKK